MTRLEALKAARSLIQDPSNWTQGCTAALADGTKTWASDPYAVKYCAWGALCHVLDEIPTPMFSHKMLGELIHFNDANNHGMVLRYFDQLIAEEAKRHVKELEPA